MGGGSRNYADMYAKYKQGSASDSDFESYVDSQGDLKNAWAKIQSDPDAWDSKYWIDRGATSKAAFGRAHAAEDHALYSGTYQGATDFTKGSDAWKDYFQGRSGTRFDDFQSGGGGGGNGQSPWATARGGGAPGSEMYPLSLVNYTPPSEMTDIARELQPWLQPDHIPDSLWNYQPPTLDEWEIQRDWDWAQKPASAYAPPPPSTATTTSNGGGGGGDQPDPDHDFDHLARQGYTSSAPYSGWNDFMASLGFNSQGLMGQAGREVGLADQNAAFDAETDGGSGGWTVG